jgi:hypothetical protein
VIVLDEVALVANAIDEIRPDDTLPEASALPVPTPVCFDASDCPPGM